MLKLIIPLALSITGLGVGAGAGLYLRPPADHAPAEGEHHEAPDEHAPEDEVHDVAPDYFKMSNQFVVPLLNGQRINSLVILNLSLEITAGTTEQVFAREPKLRDVFLRLLFDHANGGGFRDDFTDAKAFAVLREGLLEEAKKVLGAGVSDVLITDIVRQDN